MYFTGDRPGLEAQIHSEVLHLFARHLDAMGDMRRLSLFLYTRGGETLAAWTLANLLRQFCKELEVIVPSKAHSAGTLLALAAQSIIMTRQATLGPIDPSVQGPLNPGIPGAPTQARVPVSVEDVSAFIDFAKSITDWPELQNTALRLLASRVHPLVLGSSFRARGQIKMLARKLMAGRPQDEEEIERLLSFLCSESGSHDYTIDRREAKDNLGLPIEEPDGRLYALIKALYDDLAEQLLLSEPFNPMIVLGAGDRLPYSFDRAVIESLAGGSDVFQSEGTLTRQIVPTPQGPQQAVQDQRIFEGWRHSDANAD